MLGSKVLLNSENFEFLASLYPANYIDAKAI